MPNQELEPTLTAGVAHLIIVRTMKERMTVGVVALAGLTCIFAIALSLDSLRRRAQVTQYNSAVQTLYADTRSALDSQFKETGSYPSDLHSLKYPDHGDEFCPSMLKDLIYTPLGTSYELDRGTNLHGFAEYLEWKKQKKE